MCGIAGYLNPEGHPPTTQEEILTRMLSIIRHRGPEGAGILTSPLAALGAVRLSIVDLEHGQQPIGNETSDVFVVFNGEIFNHRELRQELENRGHRFATHADTEVLVHLYEEHGVDFLGHLNGQFAIALWDVKKEQLLLARDRPGIRPLFYTQVGKQLIFASEIKSVLCYPGVKRVFHGEGLDQILTFWTTIGKTTLFEGINELPPAHYMLVRRDGEPRIQRYWDYDFPGSSSPERADFALQKEKLDAVLSEAVRLQLRADVPVGVYLSGGLDSSVLSALVSRCTADRFKTFSVEFEDATLDESRFQHAVAARYGTEHHAVRCSPRDVGTVFPEVIWHTEKPVFRTAPAPLYLLSKLVRDHGIKVVLTGEGADEMLWGYDTFKEQKIREFWRRRPESQMRPLLLKRLFPYLSHYSNNRYYQLIRMFYQTDLMSEDASGYSHLPRWRNNAALKSLYSTDFRASLGTVSPRDTLDSLLPGHFDRWQSLERNQYLETMTLLPGYLLSSQGDRMSMAHSVEGRVPFLDH
ncbi:MAG: asparagine synthase (glutamine-hydrolyzing), partial [Verrucomicrobiia bacterium]